MTEKFDRLAFAPEEYLARRDALRALMVKRGIDVVVLTTTENTYYLTGFGSLAYGATALVMRVDGKAVWVMRRTELSNVRALADQLWVNEGIGVADGDSHAEVLNTAIADLADANAVVAMEFAAVQPILRGFVGPRNDGRKLVDASGLVEHLRRIKSTAEIDLMKRAGVMAARACRDGFEALTEGITDSALAAVVTDSLLRNGSGRMAQMPNVCAGPRSARAHVTWCGAPILRGDLINIEPAASVHDYHTPIYRFYSIGAPQDIVRRMFDVCRSSLDEGYARIRPGMTSHEAARIFETVIEKAGFAEYMVTRPAYSIGAAFPPGWGEDNVMAIRSGNEQLLEEGMCFHVVPCLYRDGIGCVAASMPSVLTHNGFESLSQDEVVFGIK
ncbi:MULTISPECIES: M24 family metallopeptidase [Aminobacter]|jgi:Xaa-Pro dipeptidase|uniref:Xaa-Pro aminopeptidase n=2 Tax=Aminobacter TaxID=31988 RepID=A0AAC8YKL1_AMIAI|nr:MULTISPECIES: Xaa-Pro peptidase family protein [Aminobacter]AMS40057.1 Xaa-Pro aminopeptidase [Aminobacter aminovorans]MBA8909794.1 Xaa-Pro dipeptidase [Aminobacter ciceronei]MBA9023610.1 Xaa-Pro dipeptidase [Aminobacter ciceronei]MBB3709322.1 Xaa-Pro dipeptidase [Aminobacter aminovorans]MRX36725.1 M24 family metallopeptidase [Aminobacter sp. MDW-2]